jgi:hypothetical protein
VDQLASGLSISLGTATPFNAQVSKVFGEYNLNCAGTTKIYRREKLSVHLPLYTVAANPNYYNIEWNTSSLQKLIEIVGEPKARQEVLSLLRNRNLYLRRLGTRKSLSGIFEYQLPQIEHIGIRNP